MISTGKDFVGYALEIGAIELVPEGRVLKSGRVSPYFFNSALFSTGQTLANLMSNYAAAIIDVEGIDIEGVMNKVVIFGPAYKGIPLAATVAIALWDYYGVQAGYAFNRKEAKDHGEDGVVVGHSLDGANVVIVDDVMTTGGSCGDAVEVVRTYGGNPILCCIAFDRQEKEIGGEPSAVQKFVQHYGVPVHAVATLADLIAVLEEDNGNKYPLGVEILPQILDYRERYGVHIS